MVGRQVNVGAVSNFLATSCEGNSFLLLEFGTKSKQKSARALVMHIQFKKITDRFLPGELQSKLLGVFTDSAGYMRSAFVLRVLLVSHGWFPLLPTFRCFMHKLNWIFKDICVVEWVARML